MSSASRKLLTRACRKKQDAYIPTQSHQFTADWATKSYLQHRANIKSLKLFFFIYEETAEFVLQQEQDFSRFSRFIFFLIAHINTCIKVALPFQSFIKRLCWILSSVWSVTAFYGLLFLNNGQLLWITERCYGCSSDHWIRRITSNHTSLQKKSGEFNVSWLATPCGKPVSFLLPTAGFPTRSFICGDPSRYQYCLNFCFWSWRSKSVDP